LHEEQPNFTVYFSRISCKRKWSTFILYEKSATDKRVVSKVKDGLDSSMDWIGLEWIGYGRILRVDRNWFGPMTLFTIIMKMRQPC